MNLTKKRAPLLKRREKVLEMMKPYQDELGYIDAQLKLIEEWERLENANAKPTTGETPERPAEGSTPEEPAAGGTTHPAGISISS